MKGQKARQDIGIGPNIRKIRVECGWKGTELAGLLQLENISMTREALVKIVRGVRHIQASQPGAVKKALNAAHEELLERQAS